MKVIAITGTSRDTRKGEVADYLEQQKPDVVIVGDALGVDLEARTWAKRRALLIECHAPWEAEGKPKTRGMARTYWPGAGPFRNGAIALVAQAYQHDGHKVTLAAFPDDQSRGTWDCVERCGNVKALVFPGDPKWQAMAQKRGLWP